MFDVGADELLVIAVVAIFVIGPKDMPMALRTAGRWIGKVRRVSNHFRAGIETMIREAEMEEMEKKWQEQNRKVMEAHPSPPITADNGGGTDLVTAEPAPAPENLLPVELSQPAPVEPAAKAPAKRKPAAKPAAKPKAKPAATPRSRKKKEG